MKRKTVTGIGIKQTNRTSIYNYMYQEGLATKQNIVNKLNISLPTVTNNITALENQGLLRETEVRANTGGRRAKTYDIVPDARTAVGLDITRHHITAVAVDLRGTVIASTRTRQRFERTEAYYKKLGEQVDLVIERAALAPEQILGVGIGIPALTADDNQTIFYGKILEITGATCAEFSSHIPYPTAMFNDANAAAFAEFWGNREMYSAFYIMLSNNIGGAAMVHDRIYSGNHLHSCEVGHLTIVPGGKPCYCGKRGCVDAYCAATVLSSQTDGDLDAFFQQLRGGDKQLQKQWDIYLNYLAAAISNVFMLFDCPIILGGYVGAYLGEYLDDLKRRARGNMDIFGDDTGCIQVCCYEKESIAAGSALHFIKSFLDTI